MFVTLTLLVSFGIADVVYKLPRICPAETFWRDVVPPCIVVYVTDEFSNTVSILKCPVTGQYYQTRTWEKFDIDAHNLVKAFLTTNNILGVVATDLVGYVSVTVKQGKVTFGYPFDYRFPTALSCTEENDNFLRQPIMQNMVDGDFVSYISNGTNFSAWATFAAKDNKLHWHNCETFELLEKAPIPDADADFLYYRMQDTNTHMTISGGVYSKNSGFRSFEEFGVEGATHRPFTTLREVNWADNLLGGVSKWTREFKPTSIRDPRKFYVRLSSGERAFAMIHGDRKKLFSPITHSALTVENTEIEGFEPIADGAYKEEDCYSKNEVAEIWDDFSSDRGWFDMALEKLCGEHYIYGKPIKSLWGAFKYWILFIYVPGVLWKRTRPAFLKPLQILLKLLKCVWRRKR